jgi:hypothetical protein
MTGPCSTEFDFEELFQQFPELNNVTFQLSPESPGNSKEIIIESVTNLNNPNLVSVQMIMKVSEIGSDGLPQNESWDEKADKLSWYTTNPNLLGSSFQCQNLNDSNPLVNHNQFGCVYPTGCSLTKCADSPAELSAACDSFELEDDDWVCAVGSEYVEPVCYDGGGSFSYFTHAGGSNTAKGAFVSIDISPIQGALFLQNFSPVLTLSVDKFNANFDASGCPLAGDPVACGQTICTDYADEFSNLQFYLLNPTTGPTDPLLMCEKLSDESIATPSVINIEASPLGAGPVLGWVDTDPSEAVDNYYSCSRPYDVDTPSSEYVFDSTSAPGVVFIGIRYPPGSDSSLNLHTLSPLAVGSSAVVMSAFYYSP